jgi:hypothetical protein
LGSKKQKPYFYRAYLIQKLINHNKKQKQMALIIEQNGKNQLIVDGKFCENLDAEVLKRKLLEPGLEIYFNCNRFYYDKVIEKYYSKVRIRLDNSRSVQGKMTELGYEGNIYQEYEEENKSFAQWSTMSVINPTLYDAYKCFLKSLLLRLS